MTNPVDVEKAIKRTRAFKFYYDKGDAVANTEAEDAMALLSAYDTQAAENKRLTDIVEQPAQVIQKYLIENATQAAEIKRLMSELEQVKAKLIASEAVIQTQIYGKYGIEHYSKITTELTAELEQVKAERDGYCNAVNEKYCDLHSFMELEGCPLCELEQVKANRDWWKSRVENGSNARHWPEFGPSGR